MTADPWGGGTFGADATAWSPGLQWQDEAICKSVDVNIFFADKGQDSLLKQAKAICKGNSDRGIEPCPVLEQCKEHALETGEPHGIWGGLSPKQRQRERTERKRANGGRVRCRVCRRMFVAATASHMDCSHECRLASKRARDRRLA